MKKVVSLVLAGLMLTGAMLGFVGCGKAQNLESIKEAGKLTVYTEAGFAPYEFMYENEIVGVDIEIMKLVAEKIGVELEITDVAFATICTSVKSAKADVGAAGITITDERKEDVAFSDPYTKTEQYMVVAADNDDIKTLEDLKGKKVGVQEGTTSDILVNEFVADKTLEGTVVTAYPAPAVAAAAVPAKIDAVVTDKLTAETIVANNSGLKTFKLVKADGSDVGTEYYGIAVNKANTELLAVINEVLADLVESGKVKEWEDYYTELSKQSAAE